MCMDSTNTISSIFIFIVMKMKMRKFADNNGSVSAV